MVETAFASAGDLLAESQLAFMRIAGDVEAVSGLSADFGSCLHVVNGEEAAAFWWMLALSCSQADMFDSKGLDCWMGERNHRGTMVAARAGIRAAVC
jgi:hypothetical protein